MSSYYFSVNSLKKSPTTSTAFSRSIALALRNPPDVEASVNRIKHTLRRLPNNKLYTADHGSEVSFYTVEEGHQKYTPKRSDTIYALAKRKYLLLLLEILELTSSHKTSDIRRREKLIVKLQNLIILYSRGSLNIARILLTSKQYKWYVDNYIKKRIGETMFHSGCRLTLRSKSERDIANQLESFAVPYHYEEQTVIDVRYLVQRLEDKLRSDRRHSGRLFSYHNGMIVWNVPPELEWMNAHGSIWNTYDSRSGTIAIFPDFRIMLASGEFIIWEHEGLMDDFIYRCNATERAAIMKCTETVTKENFIETYEQDVDTPEKLIDIIERRVLPRLWF